MCSAINSSAINHSFSASALGCHLETDSRKCPSGEESSSLSLCNLCLENTSVLPPGFPKVCKVAVRTSFPAKICAKWYLSLNFLGSLLCYRSSSICVNADDFFSSSLMCIKEAYLVCTLVFSKKESLF